MIEYFALNHLQVKFLHFEGCLHRHVHWSRVALCVHSVGLIGLEPNLLLLNRVILVQFLQSGLLAHRTTILGVLVVVSSGLCDLLSVDGLFFVVKKTNALLLHHPLDGLLDLLVVESEVDVLGVNLTNLLSEFLVKLHAYLLHDLQVGSLCHLRNDFTPVLVVQVRL